MTQPESKAPEGADRQLNEVDKQLISDWGDEYVKRMNFPYRKDAKEDYCNGVKHGIIKGQAQHAWRSISSEGLPGEGDEDDQFLLFNVERRHVFAMRSRRYIHAYPVLTKAAYTHWRQIELPSTENKNKRTISNETSQYFSKEDENALWLMNELNRRSIFFIEEKATQRWVEDDIGPNFDGDWITNNPSHAKRFETKFQAMTWMIRHVITFDKWCITEHQFI